MIQQQGKTVRKKVAAVVLTLFTIQQILPQNLGYAQTVSATSVGGVMQIHIPQNLGRMEEGGSRMEEGGRMTDEKTPFVLHIQNAHGSYEAQKNIQGLLNYLKDSYGFKLLMLEGASGKLTPEVFNFFPNDKSLNLKIAQDLTENSEFTGAELFLLEHPGMKAYGMENTKPYRINRKAFQKVLKAEEKTSSFLEDMNSQIERLTSPYLNQSLKNFLRHIEAYETKKIDLVSWLNFLQKEAKPRLGVDLNDPFYQKEWPLLVRFFRLQKIEKEFNPQAFQTEKTTFLEKLDSLKVDKGLRHTFKSILDLPKDKLTDNSTLPYLELLRAYQDLVTALPQDFSFDSFHQVKLYLQLLMIQHEMRGSLLLEEIARLESQLVDKLVRTETEKELVDLFKDYRLLQKLFRLELTQPDYQELIQGRQEITPSQMTQRFTEVNHEKRVKNVKFTHLKEIDSLFNLAFSFYRGAKQRDTVMATTLLNTLKDLKETKAVIVTGGFHSEGMKEHLEAQGLSYFLISPKITQAGDTQSYHKAILEEGNELKTSQIENVLKLQPLEKMIEEGLNPDHLRLVIAKALTENLDAMKLAAINTKLLVEQYKMEIVKDGNNPQAISIRFLPKKEGGTTRMMKGELKEGAARSEVRGGERNRFIPRLEQLEDRELMATSVMQNPLDQSLVGQTSTAVQTQPMQIIQPEVTTVLPNSEPSPVQSGLTAVITSTTRDKITVKDQSGNIVFNADYSNKIQYGSFPIDAATIVTVNNNRLLIVDLANQIDVINMEDGKSISLDAATLINPASAVGANLSLTGLAMDQRGTITYTIAAATLEILNSERKDFPVVQPSGSDLTQVTQLPGLIHNDDKAQIHGLQLAEAKRKNSDTLNRVVGNAIVMDANRDEGAGASFDKFGTSEIETGRLPEEFVIGLYQTGTVRFEAVSIDPVTRIEKKASIILEGSKGFNTYRITAQSLRDQGVDTNQMRILYAINPNQERTFSLLYLGPQTMAQPLSATSPNQDYQVMAIDGRNAPFSPQFGIGFMINPLRPELGRPHYLSITSLVGFSLGQIAGIRFLVPSESPVQAPIVELTFTGDKKIHLFLLGSGKEVTLWYRDYAPSSQGTLKDNELFFMAPQVEGPRYALIFAGQTIFPAGTLELPAIGRTLLNSDSMIVSTLWISPATGKAYNNIGIVDFKRRSYPLTATIQLEVPQGTKTEDFSFKSGRFIDATHAQIDFHNGRSFLIDVAAKTAKELLPSVPADWTRAASNPNFAVRIAPDSNVPQILNLVTGEIKAAAREFYPGSTGMIDVSPDGQAAIVVSNGTAPYVYVSRMNNPKNENPSGNYARIEGNFRSMSFEPGKVKIETNQTTATITISNLDVVQTSLPAKAIQAPTNPNFHYVIEREQSIFGGTPTLTLYEKTPLGYHAISVISRKSRMDGISQSVDVSPDGKVIVYGQRHAESVVSNGYPHFSHFEYELVAQRIGTNEKFVLPVRSVSNPNQDWNYADDPKQIMFTPEAAIITSSDKTYQLDLTTLQIKLTDVPPPTDGSLLARNPNLSRQVSGLQRNVLTITNAENGASFRYRFGAAIEKVQVFARFTLVDLANGKIKLIANDFSTPGKQGGILTLTGDKVVSLDINNVDLEIKVAGPRKTYLIDLEKIAPKPLPLPSGWTNRAFSNPDFAIRIGNSYGQYAEILNLKTGKQRVAASEFYPGTVGFADVSPDGQVAIISYNGTGPYVYVSRIDRPAKYQRVEGAFKSMAFDSGNVIVVTDQTKATVNMSTLDLMRTNLPQQALATSHPDFHYVIEREQSVFGAAPTLTLYQKTVTGYHSLIMVARDESFSGISQTVDVSSDGKTVVYGQRTTISATFSGGRTVVFDHYEHQLVVKRIETGEKLSLFVRNVYDSSENWNYAGDPQKIVFTDEEAIITTSDHTYRVNLATLQNVSSSENARSEVRGGKNKARLGIEELERRDMPSSTSLIQEPLLVNPNSAAFAGKVQITQPSEFVMTSTAEPSLPSGWTRAASNPNFAFQIRPDATQLNLHLYLIDLKNPTQEILVGGGSRARHSPELFDVSPDGKLVVSSYHEFGPVVGNLSEVLIHKIEDLTAGNRQPAQRIGEAVAGSIKFQGDHIVIEATVRGPRYHQNQQTIDKVFFVNRTTLEVTTGPETKPLLERNPNLSSQITGGYQRTLVITNSENNSVFRYRFGAAIEKVQVFAQFTLVDLANGQIKLIANDFSEIGNQGKITTLAGDTILSLKETSEGQLELKVTKPSASRHFTPSSLPQFSKKGLVQTYRINVRSGRDLNPTGTAESARDRGTPPGFSQSPKGIGPDGLRSEVRSTPQRDALLRSGQVRNLESTTLLTQQPERPAASVSPTSASPLATKPTFDPLSTVQEIAEGEVSPKRVMISSVPRRSELRSIELVSQIIMDQIIPLASMALGYGLGFVGEKIFNRIFKTRLQTLEATRKPLSVSEEQLANAETKVGSFNKIRLKDLLTARDDSFAIVAISIPRGISADALEATLVQFKSMLQNHPKKPIVLSLMSELPEGFQQKMFEEFNGRLFIFQGDGGQLIPELYTGKLSRMSPDNQKMAKLFMQRASELSGHLMRLKELKDLSLVALQDEATFEGKLFDVSKQFVRKRLQMSARDHLALQLLTLLPVSALENAQLLQRQPDEFQMKSINRSLRFSFKSDLLEQLKTLVQAARAILVAA